MIVVVIALFVLVELVGRGGGAVASAGVCAVGWGEGRLHTVVTNRERDEKGTTQLQTNNTHTSTITLET